MIQEMLGQGPTGQMLIVALRSFVEAKGYDPATTDINFSITAAHIVVKPAGEDAST